ncbi:hypothetical protein FDF76_12935 [Clostridium botulinum]|nr:hypothetical protein [Clostridium botulinum]NFF37391.1 hypothetical protein [Clostridium botulinum]NFI49503.1 hypothetical protein [Clostridium botulinum]NFI60102.1 hypothetical protein [Clostridium botulinum]NFI69526.1 hypothetical protein [Clostridium botulinum]
MKDWEGQYDEDAIKIINSYKLTNKEKLELAECLKKLEKSKPYILNIFEDMYKLYKGGLLCNKICEYYNRNERSIQYIFKHLKIEKTLKEVQAIAKGHRDYAEIRKTFKKTMLNRFIENNLFGTKIENVIRVEASNILNSLLKDAEVIVGINTVNYVGELDIPIIVIKNNIYYKYAIEVDGAIFHNGKQSDINKSKKMDDIGYKIFRLETKAYVDKNNKTKRYSETKENLISICNEIYFDVHGENKKII